MTDSKAGIENDELASKLKDFLNAKVGESESRWSYLKAASLVSFYDIKNIKPMDGVAFDEQEAEESLMPESSLSYDKNRQPRWMLRNETRREALIQLDGEENIRHALESIPDRPDDSLQKTLENYIFHRSPPLEEQNPRELLDTLQVAEWLTRLVSGVPDPEKVCRKIEIENLLASFRFLAGDHFRGREAELKRLAEYVGVIEAGSFISRSFNYVFSIREKPPLFVHGPGGVGKSSLLAKFVLDHVSFISGSEPGETISGGAAHQDRRFPFAYLDFDRRSLLAEEPITLLHEALRQLEIQFPGSSRSIRKVRESWSQRIANRSPRKRSENASSDTPRIDNRSLFLKEFAEEIQQLTLGEKPFLMILDTFEEVQYRSRAFVEEIFSFLDELQELIPTLRTVLSGRVAAESTKFQTDNLQLLKFDPESAQAFLISHGIVDPELAKQVADQVGGSPLTLKLAVQLLDREAAGTSGIKDLKTRDVLFRRLEDEAIRAQLFTRILEHIHDPEVVKLAHPGLVLRRVTPDLILRVLAEPCGVKVEDFDHAKVLFDKLSEEVSLVTPVSHDVIEHRADLRSVMLEPLRKDKPQEIDAIHRGAIHYYKAFDDDISRAEEIYHRLSLGLDRPVLNDRWRDGVRQHLGSAIEELPIKAKAFLSAKMDIEAAENVWNQADLEDWEVHVERRARDLLELKQPLQAVAALRQRSERITNSPLLGLEWEVVITALKQMVGFFSVYKSEQINRAAMSKVYQALVACLRDLNVSAEVLIAVRRNLALDDQGGADDASKGAK